METRVRRATERDIGFLAQIMYQSMFPGANCGLFDRALSGTGTDPISFNAALLRTGANNWGQLDRYLVLVDANDRKLGAASAFLSNCADRRPLTAEGVEMVAAQLGWSADITRDFFRSYVSTFGMFGRSPQLDHPCDYVIEYAAMHSEFRGRGLYARLLQAHVELAEAQGFRVVGHTAVSSNGSVLRALMKFGFQQRWQFGAERFQGMFPGLTRLSYEF